MPKRIEKLSLAGFRGATVPVDIPFEPAKPITLIFGENGSGKSTIIDALDFVCNKEFGSIVEKSGTNPKDQYVVSLKSAAKDLRVTLKINGEPQPWVATLERGLPSVSGKDHAPRARILRRSQILKIINERPADRYKALEGFIALPGIESSEQALRDCIQGIKGDFENATRAKTQSEASLSDSWRDEGKPGTDFLTWAKERGKADASVLRASVASLGEIQDALATAQRAVDSWGLSLKDRNEKEGRFQKAEQAVKALEAAAKESDLIDLLKDAQKYLPHAIRPEECPLCERPGVEVASLLNRIAVRLAEMNRTALLKTALDTSKKAYETALTTNTNDRATLILSAWTLAGALSKSSVPEVIALHLDWLKFPNMKAATSPSDTDEVFREAQTLQISAKACLDPLKKRREAETRALNQLGMIQRGVASVQENTKKAEDSEAQQKRAQAVLKVIEKRRKDFTDKILADISKEVGDLCEVIHPGEGVKVRFFLNPSFRNSLESSAEFAGVKDVPPQAYYSESHLDTIGVCIFMALAKRFGGGDEIVVLDDVVTSVDAPHMERFMDLLISQASHFGQLIVATHYRPWLERFRHARGPSASVQLLRLGPWSLTRGIRHGRIKVAVEELKDAVAADPFDRQAVASKAGIFLESLLDQLTLLYKCRMPRVPEPDYTLGELMGGFGKGLRTALKSVVHADGKPPKETSITAMLDDIDTFNWIRNQVGGHWNFKGFDVPDADVAKYAQRITDLAEVLICVGCGSLPTKNRGESHWHCRCGESKGLRLFPLENPDN